MRIGLEVDKNTSFTIVIHKPLKISFMIMIHLIIIQLVKIPILSDSQNENYFCILLELLT